MSRSKIKITTVLSPINIQRLNLNTSYYLYLLVNWAEESILQCNHVINAPKHICICITEEYKNTCTRFNLIMGITFVQNSMWKQKKRPKCGLLEVRTKPYQIKGKKHILVKLSNNLQANIGIIGKQVFKRTKVFKNLKFGYNYHSVVTWETAIGLCRLALSQQVKVFIKKNRKTF